MKTERNVRERVAQKHKIAIEKLPSKHDLQRAFERFGQLQTDRATHAANILKGCITSATAPAEQIAQLHAEAHHSLEISERVVKRLHKLRGQKTGLRAYRKALVELCELRNAGSAGRSNTTAAPWRRQVYMMLPRDSALTPDAV